MGSDSLPDCGLYRTGVSLVSHEEQVTAGCLVSFHNHSDRGIPMVQTPHNNENNRWTFHDHGFGVEDPGFLRALIPLKPEGLYVVTENHLHISEEEIISERTLVQLGYNRSADSILFVAKQKGNTIVFPTKGFRFESPDFQTTLQPVAFSVSKSKSNPTTSQTLH
jgi:hypothetical protein